MSSDVLESRVELDFDGCEPDSEGGLSIDFLVFLLHFNWLYFEDFQDLWRKSIDKSLAIVF